MKEKIDAIVIGGGIGGLCSAVLLAAQGLAVHVIERSSQLGGKAGIQMVDELEVDTGPSVLTLPHVFDEVFTAAGLDPREMLRLRRPDPSFRYLYRDGAEIDVFMEQERTVDSVRRSLGGTAAKELEGYLASSRRIWEAAAPHFVYSSAPDISGLLFGGLSKWGAVTKIDPFRTLSQSIDDQVKSEHLRMLLKRYATYNGSDPRSAPATLGCIAHVELSLGGFGVEGGMFALVRALQEAMGRLNVRVHLDTEVTALRHQRGKLQGVELADGSVLECRQVVANADAAHVNGPLLGRPPPKPSSVPLSMSGYTGVLRAGRQKPGRPAHTVYFPHDYEQEFRDIFEHRRVPECPTIYLCAQEACHGRRGWEDAEPVFCMINAPSVDAGGEQSGESVRERVLSELRKSLLIRDADRLVWWRTPTELAEQFPGSQGALYGAASNSRSAAFRRPANRHPDIQGLYLASGSAHPGGGVPMVALSAKQAAHELLKDRRAAA